jgi:hypothetical protein
MAMQAFVCHETIVVTFLRVPSILCGRYALCVKRF